MKKYIVGLFITVATSLCLIGCNNKAAKKDDVIPAKAEWTLDQSRGADIVVLDFASEDRIIFHGYFGLFVRDLGAEKITHSLDLKYRVSFYTGRFIL